MPAQFRYGYRHGEDHRLGRAKSRRHTRTAEAGFAPAVDLLVGNSSSGIMETASLKKPAVNIGRRQQGREHGRNVLNAATTIDSILECTRRALDTDFLQSLEGYIRAGTSSDPSRCRV